MATENLSLEFTRSQSHTLDQAVLKIEHCLAQISAADVWCRPAPGLNSIGNLILHLSGNLRQWGIVPFSGEPDQRQREQEFQQEDPIPVETLRASLTKTVQTAKTEWQKLSDPDLTSVYTIQGFQVSGCQAITHTVAHFVGHTHQIILMTRLMLGESYRFHWSPSEPRDDVPI